MDGARVLNLVFILILPFYRLPSLSVATTRGTTMGFENKSRDSDRLTKEFDLNFEIKVKKKKKKKKKRSRRKEEGKKKERTTNQKKEG